MAIKVKIELTIKEAEEFWLVAGNGYGDGDFFRGNGTGHEHNSYIRAEVKVADAIHKARQGK